MNAGQDNNPTANGQDDNPTEEDLLLLAELDVLFDKVDPMPADLVERVQFAIALEDLDVEVARWQRDQELAGVRGAGPNTVTFTVEDLTIMVSFAPAGGGYRFDGWLVPGGPHTVEVRVAGHTSTTTAADEGGRFAVDQVPKGTTQLVIHLAAGHGGRGRTVVTPTLVL
ncbi:hypothetical protein GCM10010174_90450 [Kutzneria viridogrisea]|uniref:Carboxypeptidase regulatory-like domain-containing protein n=1 Tax=Kutzneria viridogrisea TaxID=47990 RepID=A0ABR6BWL3_9PSEU|nr:hypothetical protein [Kutzneria viridogrisea]